MELQKAIKIHFAQKLNPFSKLFLNRVFKGLFWIRSDTSKVILIPNEYLNIQYIIISLSDSFRAQTLLKNSLQTKTNLVYLVSPKSSLSMAFLVPK